MTSVQTSNETTCAHCGEALASPLYCGSCSTVQRPDPTRDHFATLGLPARYGLDVDDLERVWMESCGKVHPDRTAGDLKPRAVLQTAQLNEAYSVLRDWYQRADYLLSLLGGPSASDDKRVPGGFLEQMLEWRDELEDAIASGDRARLRVLRSTYKHELHCCELAIGAAFRQVDESAADSPERTAAFTEVRSKLNVASYYRTMLRDLRENGAPR